MFPIQRSYGRGKWVGRCCPCPPQRASHLLNWSGSTSRNQRHNDAGLGVSVLVVHCYGWHGKGACEDASESFGATQFPNTKKVLAWRFMVLKGLMCGEKLHFWRVAKCPEPPSKGSISRPCRGGRCSSEGQPWQEGAWHLPRQAMRTATHAWKPLSPRP